MGAVRLGLAKRLTLQRVSCSSQFILAPVLHPGDQALVQPIFLFLPPHLLVLGLTDHSSHLLSKTSLPARHCAVGEVLRALLAGNLTQWTLHGAKVGICCEVLGMTITQLFAHKFSCVKVPHVVAKWSPFEENVPLPLVPTPTEAQFSRSGLASSSAYSLCVAVGAVGRTRDHRCVAVQKLLVNRLCGVGSELTDWEHDVAVDAGMVAGLVGPTESIGVNVGAVSVPSMVSMVVWLVPTPTGELRLGARRPNPVTFPLNVVVADPKASAAPLLDMIGERLLLGHRVDLNESSSLCFTVGLPLVPGHWRLVDWEHVAPCAQLSPSRGAFWNIRVKREKQVFGLKVAIFENNFSYIEIQRYYLYLLSE